MALMVPTSWSTVDIGNVRTAWRRAVELRDMRAVSQAAECLFMYSEMRGEFVEAETSFRQAVAAFSEIANQDMDDADRETFQSQLGFLLVLHGFFASHIGSPNGPELTKRGAELVHTHTDTQSRQRLYRKALCYMLSGWGGFLIGSYDASEQNLQKSQSIFAELNERWGIAKSLFMLSNTDIRPRTVH